MGHSSQTWRAHQAPALLVDRKPSRDPTGTAGLRADFRAEAIRRLRDLRSATQRMVNHETADAYTAAVRLDALGWWFEGAMRHAFGGPWMIPFIADAWNHGTRTAQAELGARVLHVPSKGTLEILAKRERDGIAAALLQQLSRAAELAMARGRARVWPQLAPVFDTVGINRARALANTLIIRSFNDSKLCAYAESGVTHIGVTPETVAAKPRHAAPRLTKPRPTKPRRAASRLDSKQSIAFQDVLVGVVTAGDDDVCPDCEDIADDAPYEIAEAIGLLPAHPNCRCSIYPFSDERYAGDAAAKPGLTCDAVEALIRKDATHVARESAE